MWHWYFPALTLSPWCEPEVRMQVLSGIAIWTKNLSRGDLWSATGVRLPVIAMMLWLSVIVTRCTCEQKTQQLRYSTAAAMTLCLLSRLPCALVASQAVGATFAEAPVYTTGALHCADSAACAVLSDIGARVQPRTCVSRESTHSICGEASWPGCVIHGSPLRAPSLSQASTKFIDNQRAAESFGHMHCLMLAIAL